MNIEIKIESLHCVKFNIICGWYTQGSLVSKGLSANFEVSFPLQNSKEYIVIICERLNINQLTVKSLK